MGLVEGIREEDATGLVKEVFEDMKRVRGWDRIPVIWRVMAVQPEYLKANWDRYRSIMLRGSIDLRVKEMLALAVSMVNRCSY
ncbi:MAG: carboxymuconolactone decarboxylase family protein [Sulfobacillus sp.]